MTDYFEIIGQFGRLLTAAGIWGIFRKCGVNGWLVLIPGYRYFKLGQLCGKAREGWLALLLFLITDGLTVALRFVDPGSMAAHYLAIGALTALITEAAVTYWIATGMLWVFDVNRKWAIRWALFPWFVTCMLGFGKKYQPVNLGKEEDDLLAGTTPAEIRAAIKAATIEDGLEIHLKEKTVRKQGRKRYLLKDVYLAIPNGSLVLLLGGSGAGKTTLVNAITGYEKANARIRLNGTDVYQNYKQMKYRIGFVPQQDILRLNDRVVSTLSDAAKMRLPKNVSAAERKKRVNEVIEILGMEGRQDGLVAKKSGGQKKRISIGMELISDPELFILDEPDSGLDGVIARELFEKLRSIADTGKIVITITHTPDRVADLFDQVIVLARDSGKVGRLAFSGTPQEAKEFFGKDSMENIVMAINRKEEGGEGRADEFIRKFAEREMTEHEQD